VLDLPPDIVGAELVGLLAEEHVLIIGEPECEATGIPHPVEFALPLFGRGLQNRFPDKVVFEPKERFADPLDNQLYAP
jgi:hypothetical protein